jgi:cell division protein FtsB
VPGTRRAPAARARRPGATAARTPFVVLVVTLLAGGLISLLLLNSAVNQDSFELNKLRKQTTGYTDEQQALQQEVDGYSDPGALARRARQMGMVPGGVPVFLDPAGKVHGTPQEATAPPPPPTPTATPTTAPAGAAATAAGGPSGAPAPATTATAPSTPTSPTTPPTTSR